MAFVVADRVRETSTSTGTGTLTLAGAVIGYQAFSAAIGNGNTTYYAISNPGVNEWEVGIGTVGSGTLARTTVLASSTGTSLVSFTAGSKDVFVTYPAEGAVFADNAITLTNKTISGASNTLSNIGNASLTNSSLTVGSTNIALGGTATTLAGLTSVTATTFNGALSGNATTATTATNLAGGIASQIPYQTSAGTTSFIANGSPGQVLKSTGTTAPAWANVSDLSVTTFSGGTTGLTPSTPTGGAVTLGGTLASANGGTGFSTYATGDLIYASGTNTLAKLGAGASGYVLSIVAGVPSWVTPPPSGASIVNDTATASNLYPLFANATSGAATTVYTSNAKYLYKPSTGDLQASQLVASNGLVLNATTLVESYTIPIGQSAYSVGGASGFTIPSGKAVTVSSGSRWVLI